MILTHLTLSNVRNYTSLDLAPEPGLNVFVGPNAQGKSNLLEAIGLLGTGKSFRTAREGEIVRAGMPSAALAGEALVAAGSIRLACTLNLGTAGVRKVYAVNGRGVRYAGYLGKLRVVTFVPAHLALVSGPPSARRSLVNGALAQESPAYYAALASYQTFLRQKNALLRGSIAPDETLLATYDQRLVETGTRLMLARRAFVAALDERAKAVHRSWVGDREGEFEIAYVPEVPIDVPTVDAVEAAFAARIAAKRVAEVARRTALVGPHRDDVAFRLGGSALAAFGSQGQQRTAVLALKVAEYGVLEARAGEAPLLLLDDVLSELDPERQRAFLRGVGSFGQAFVTTTHDVDVPVAAAYRIVAATLARVA
ncbi:MAG: DNA replication/repair protein RecF [Vulcanimicrobiaceae bacterium]